jgi:hypothetical protein
VFFAFTSLLAVIRPLEYDELFTYHLSALPHLEDIWTALAEGTDLNPPLGYLATRLARTLFGDHPIALRLPSAIGVWVMAVCLWRFVARRCSAPYAWAALLFPLASAVYPCVSEARPYGLVLGWCGLALVCWQAATEARQRTPALAGLAGSLTAAIFTHYYAVLLILPLALGELVRATQRRCADPGVALALVLPLFALVALLPGIHEARSYAATFWAKPSWDALRFTCFFLFAFVKMPLLVLAVVLIVYPRRPQWSAATEVPPLHEMAAALGLALLPVWGLLLGYLATGAYVFRYAFPAVAGLSILFAFVAYRRTAGSFCVGMAMSIAWLILFIQGEVRNYKHLVRRSAEQRETCDFLRSQGESDQPLVIADAQFFLQLTHCAPSDLGARIVYLSDPEASVRQLGHDTCERALRHLRDWAPLPVADYGPFLATHPHFLLFGNVGWLKSALAAEGARFEEVARMRTHLLFQVYLGEGANTPHSDGASKSTMRSASPSRAGQSAGLQHLPPR